MEIAPNSVVTLTYRLSIPDEENQPETIEVVEADDPMVFIQGMSGLPESFEENLLGLKPGDSFEFTLTPEEGYGTRDPEAIVELPLEVFKIEGQVPDGLLDVGNFLPMTNEDGHRLQGRVLDVKDDLVLMDFNPPLADKTMHFKGRIEHVRAATPSELDHGHVHGPGGVHHH
jgi:FKBP-type peptidyl-prolyl cis-trans isomerase SlyD